MMINTIKSTTQPMITIGKSCIKSICACFDASFMPITEGVNGGGVTGSEKKMLVRNPKHELRRDFTQDITSSTARC